MRIRILLLAASLALLPRGVCRAQDDAWRWRRVEVAERVAGGALTALAVDARSGRVAVGGLRGVALREPGARFRSVDGLAGVTALHFDALGALWIGSERGLWRLPPGGPLVERSPGAGSGARVVRRVCSVDELVAVATDAGVFVSRDAERWQRLDAALPSGPAPALAMRALGAGGGLELWLIADGEPWRALLVRGEGEVPARARTERARRPSGLAGADAVDVALGPGEGEVLLAYGDALALGRADAADAGAIRWQVVRPALPPGAVVRRVALAAGRLWLATDRGLLWATSPSGPYRRAASPVGAAPVAQVAPRGETVLAAGAGGLFEGGRRGAGPPARLARGTEPDAAVRDPGIGAVHRAALRYLELGPERIRALRRGVDRRGALPDVSLSGSYASDRDEGDDYDQSFVSGDTRYLYDHDRGRSRDLEVSLTLRWELGDLAYHPEAIDVSKERRDLIALRDDVLDEINQLYFERRRALERLAALEDRTTPEARDLRLRAEELAAGLDAWTAGWFSAQLAAGPEPSPASQPPRGRAWRPGPLRGKLRAWSTVAPARP